MMADWMQAIEKDQGASVRIPFPAFQNDNMRQMDQWPRRERFP
jgi:hypothetical protein